MNRPNQLTKYPEIDFKLGIKSSLPNVRSTISLLIMMWNSNAQPDFLEYTQEVDNKILLSEDITTSLIREYNANLEEFNISIEDFKGTINNNQLLKSQIESLIVAFELIWRLATIRFTSGRAVSSERTGNKRYNKTLHYTKNIDIVHVLISSNKNEYNKILLKWLGLQIAVNTEDEKRLLNLLMLLSEDAIYKTNHQGNDLIFNTLGIYSALSEQTEIDIDGDVEPKGSLRILKSLLSENMNSNLQYINKKVSIAQDIDQDNLQRYKSRLDTYLALSNMKTLPSGDTETSSEEMPDNIGKNILLYGVPGCGKSYYIENKYHVDDENSERVVFHPDYTYSDFVGQILPKVTPCASGSTSIEYDFIEGPFTRILQKCESDASTMYYLIIEEINRGNAPAIFGEIFQLLDRDASGVSEYGISNTEIAKKVYGNDAKKVKIPSNLTILATMNTADQNVFTLDTAFKRRWEMVAIRNDFKLKGSATPEDAEFDKQLNTKLCGSDLDWRTFATAINELIIEERESNLGSEDKRLGHFFIKQAEMGSAEKFSEKVIMYLWNDVFKFEKDKIFNAKYKTLEEILDDFRKSDVRFKVFNDRLGFNVATIATLTEDVSEPTDEE